MTVTTLRPWAIILYERLFLAWVALGLLASLAAWPMMRAVILATAQRGGTPAGAMLTMTIASMIVGTLLSLLLLWLTARRGSEIARLLTGAWFLFGLISGVRGLVLGLMPWPFLLAGAVQIVLQLVMLYLLFGTDEARDWFRSRGGRRR